MTSDELHATTIQRYMKAKYGYTGELTEYLPPRMPRHEHVWNSYVALAHFKEGGCYESLEDVPAEATTCNIVDSRGFMRYEREGGAWVLRPHESMTRETIKAVYGRE